MNYLAHKKIMFKLINELFIIFKSQSIFSIFVKFNMFKKEM